MGIPIMSPFSEVAAAPAGNDGGSRSNQGDAFASVLAVAQPKATTGDGGQGEGSDAASVVSQPAAGDQLQKLLSSLTDGKVDVRAPGLGLTNEQQEQLAAKLEKLLKSGDGATLLASLLAASQSAINAADLLALTKLLGTSAQGTISDDALESNLHLLAQGIQVMANSGGKMTLLEAVQELTSSSDAFAKQLAAALEPIPIDTGPPRAPDSGDDPRDGPEGGGSQTSATAGSNGREMTVSQTETSPADGAAEEAGGQSDQPNAQLLAEVLEALIKAQSDTKGAHAEQTAAAANKAAVAAPRGTSAATTKAADTDADGASVAATKGNIPNAAVAGQQGASQTEQAEAKASQTAADAATSQPAVKAYTPPGAGAAFDSQLDAAVAQGQASVSQSAADQTSADGQGSTNKESDKQPVIQATSSEEPVGLANPTLTISTADQIQLEAQTQPPMRAAIEQAIVDQLVQHAAIALSNGVQEFQIQLKPEFLGALDVRVSVDNGVAVIRMAAESDATRQLIEANIGQLRQAFGAGEVRVEHVPHFASSGQSWSFGDGTGQHTFWQGQNPFDGSSQLPDAIPFKGEPEAEPELVGAAATQDSSALGGAIQGSTMTPASGGIDLQA